VVTVADVLEALERLYPPELAAEWDSIGLVCGEPDAPVRSILLAVDACEATAAEACELGVDMLVTHHPLFLSGVTSVAATTAKGRVVHRLVRGGVALANAHTNADCAQAGVSDSLARALGVVDCLPLDPTGLGRVGRLSAPVTLADFATSVAGALPPTSRGVAVAGDPNLVVRRVAVCGGAGDSLLGAATLAGADVYVTADLRHHRALEHVEEGGCALIDVAHWASEWPWLEDAASAVREALRPLPGGDSVTVTVSRLRTDPWTDHRGSVDR